MFGLVAFVSRRVVVADMIADVFSERPYVVKVEEDEGKDEEHGICILDNTTAAMTRRERAQNGNRSHEPHHREASPLARLLGPGQLAATM